MATARTWAVHATLGVYFRPFEFDSIENHSGSLHFCSSKNFAWFAKSFPHCMRSCGGTKLTHLAN